MGTEKDAKDSAHLITVLGWSYDDFGNLVLSSSTGALKEAARILGAEACPDDAMERRAQAGLRAVEKELAERENERYATICDQYAEHLMRLADDVGEPLRRRHRSEEYAVAARECARRIRSEKEKL